VQKLGKYEILKELGRGAMGVVYQARDPLIGRLVALKTINANLVDRPDLLERFYQEAQSAGKLQHPNIVTIFELGQEKDTPFIAMEYLDGESLEKIISRQMDQPMAMRLGYIVRVCQALEYAHKNRVVHRDIKPGNIMVGSDGAVKVVDFGIARLVDFSRTHTNMMIGTPAYMAPELFRKKRADERTDIWAVGVTFFELLSSQRPFTGEGYDIISSILEEEVPSIRAAVPDCPEEVESVIGKMLKKAAAERYQSMEDLLLDLEPVWNRLKASEAEILAERGRELYEMGDLLKAQDRLRRARQIDSANTLAKSLLEKIATQVRRSEIEPKVREHVMRGRAFLQAGQFQEAQTEAEAALGLDSRHDTAQKLLEDVEAGVVRAQQLEQRLRLAKQRLAEGSLEEAETVLRSAFDLDAASVQALDLRKQLEGERARREKRKQLHQVVQRARELWTELKYDECLAVLAEGLKSFPNETELKTLRETALADQAEQKKQTQVAEVRKLVAQQKLTEARKSLDALTGEHKNDSSIRNLQALVVREEQEEASKKRLTEELAKLRALASAENFGEATARGESLLKEFPEDIELQDFLGYARGELAQEQEKTAREKRRKDIAALVEAHRFKEALAAARAATKEFPKDSGFHAVAADVEAKLAEQLERERAQREVQQRIQEIRGKITRQELTDAIDLARQTLATLGPDTDVTQLLHAAEVEAEQRKQKPDDKTQQLTMARTLLEKQDFAGAKQVLDRGLATRMFAATDMQVRLLQSEIRQKESALGTPEREKSEPAGAKETAKMGPASSAGSGGAGVGAPTVLADKTMLDRAARGTVRTQASAPVATPAPSAEKRLAVAAGPSTANAAEKSAIRAGGAGKKLAVAAAVTAFLVAGIFAAKRFFPKKTAEVAPAAVAGVEAQPSAPSTEDAALETEAKQLWSDHKLDDALADWKKLAEHVGPLQNEAIEQVSEIEQKHIAVEKDYADGMRLLYEEKKFPEAADKFSAVVQTNLWKVDAARKEYELASKGPGGPPLPAAPRVAPASAAVAKPSWEGLFKQGQDAFAKKEYPTALQNMQRVAKTPGVPEEINDEATQFVGVIQDRQEQVKNMDQALKFLKAGERPQAQELLGRVVAASNGDPDVVDAAKRELAAIQPAQTPALQPVTPATPAPVQPQPTPSSSPNSAASAATAGTDFGSLVREVQGLVSQGQYDPAEAKLATLSPNSNQYVALRRLIDAGRREDQAYAQARGGVAQAESAKNVMMLRQLRPFFVMVAGKPGRHSADAQGVVARIDGDLDPGRAKAPAGAGASGASDAPHLHDAGAVKAVLDAFAKAVDGGDNAAITSLTKLKDEKKAEALTGFQNTGYSLENCSTPDLSANSAKESCEVVLTKLPNSKHQKAKFQLSLVDGQWVIVGW
jgi:tetratricopeptide (TPR) repeat protein